MPTSSSAPARPRVRETPDVGSRDPREHLEQRRLAGAVRRRSGRAPASWGTAKRDVAQRPQVRVVLRSRAPLGAERLAQRRVAAEVLPEPVALRERSRPRSPPASSHHVREGRARRGRSTTRPPTSSDDDDRRRHERLRPGRGAVGDRPAEAVEHGRHRIQGVDVLPAALDERARVHDRAREEPELQRERQRQADVPVASR